MFSKVLIANRGEIALRVIRACRELGLATVMVYSEADKESLPVQFADESVCIGPPPPDKSYLSIHKIISAAEVTGAQAIHPGYGFLAENSQLPKICADHNLVFIGPSPESIVQMGDKALARQAAQRAKVRIIPGSKNAIDDVSEAKKLAEEIKFPVIIKAVGGGGGKGMRLAKNPEELDRFWEVAKNEAKAAFGNGAVYLEKYITSPRHVEIQIMADQHGNIVHLGERDCSIQRRHQKLIEESPSPILDEGLRQKMGKAAIAAAKEVGYYSVGTVEFLVDHDKSFYFLEMNTRVQVEHSVTEMVTGIDIVKEQILIAAGAKLSVRQDQVSLRGHAIELRINAEDPDRDFMPCPGTLKLFFPPGGPGVRIDSHCYPGYRIPPNYDSLIAKLIIWGRDRKEAIIRAHRALAEFAIDGVKTSIPFHQKVLAHPAFISGDFDTHFIERHLSPVSGDKKAKDAAGV